MNKARPKSFIMYHITTFDGQAECYISCYPQQRWEYRIKENKVTLSRKGISLSIPKDDFDEYWKIVE
jgi:hypothetical protein